MSSRDPPALKFYGPVFEEQNPGGEHRFSIHRELDPIAQGEECGLENTTAVNSVRNKNNVLRSQSSL